MYHFSDVIDRVAALVLVLVKVCIESTIIAMNSFSTVKLEAMMNDTKNAQASGKIFMTGRTIPIDQLSSVLLPRYLTPCRLCYRTK